MVRNEIRQNVREGHDANINRNAMRLPPNGKIAFNPQGGIRFPKLQEMFDAPNDAANANYLDYYGKPPAQVASN